MSKHDERKLYSPIQIREMLREKEDSLEEFFKNKHLSKNLGELFEVLPFMLAMKKNSNSEFLADTRENPDIQLVKPCEGRPSWEGFSIEITELFDYKKKPFNGDYKALSDNIFSSKGNKDYGKGCSLLIVDRLISPEFNVSEFSRKLREKFWNFREIWLSVYQDDNGGWTFFELLNEPGKILDWKISEKEYWY